MNSAGWCLAFPLLCGEAGCSSAKYFHCRSPVTYISARFLSNEDGLRDGHRRGANLSLLASLFFPFFLSFIITSYCFLHANWFLLTNLASCRTACGMTWRSTCNHRPAARTKTGSKQKIQCNRKHSIVVLYVYIVM